MLPGERLERGKELARRLPQRGALDLNHRHDQREGPDLHHRRRGREPVGAHILELAGELDDAQCVLVGGVSAVGGAEGAREGDFEAVVERGDDEEGRAAFVVALEGGELGLEGFLVRVEDGADGLDAVRVWGSRGVLGVGDLIEERGETEHEILEEKFVVHGCLLSLGAVGAVCLVEGGVGDVEGGDEAVFVADGLEDGAAAGLKGGCFAVKDAELVWSVM